MNKLSSTAMILAAGLGARMRPLTLEKPKPMFEVGGRTMLDHAFDKLVAFGIKRAVVNTFYLPEKIEAHLKDRGDIEIIISRETELLDTGGGIKNALKHFNGQPFFALNADLPWMDGETPSLNHMADAWNAPQMDAMLLVMPTKAARGFSVSGDFALRSNGELYRKNTTPPRPYVMLSAQILKPQLFDEIAKKKFSNNIIWDLAEAQTRLFGVEHTGTCYHVGTPEDLQKANELLTSGQGWAV